MSKFPYAIDDDQSIERVEDGISEISGTTYNQSRDAIFSIEKALGIGFPGNYQDLATFLGISFNSDGYLKTSILTSIYLSDVSNSQISANAGILESKLSLTHTTSDLFTLIQAELQDVQNLQIFTTAIDTKLGSHIAGTDANLQHTASKIALNQVPTDSRDVLFTWSGLKDKNDGYRPATEVASALLEINNDLIDHETNQINQHTAKSISVDPTKFTELSHADIDLQKTLEDIDGIETGRLAQHRQTMHANSIPQNAESYGINAPDGYSNTILTPQNCITYSAHFPGSAPIDSVTNGDDIIQLVPPTNPAEALVFESQFALIRSGDVAFVDYQNGVAVNFIIDSVRFVPGSTYILRINGSNLFDSYDLANNLLGYSSVRVDRPLYDINVYGVVATAGVNTELASPDFLGSVIISDPKNASFTGINFNPEQIDQNHYLLYLEFYPTGNPLDKSILLPPIDVTNNGGLTPGKYTLSSIVQSTNDSFRKAGYNYRFMAFEYNGNYGICLTDSFDSASFSIISSDNSSGTPVYLASNVIGSIAQDGYCLEGLGLGETNANVASPKFQTTFTDATNASTPTIIAVPKRNRNYISGGILRDFLLQGPQETRIEDGYQSIDGYIGTNNDGYFIGMISSRNITGTTVEVTYSIEGHLNSIGLKKGKTITVLPALGFSDPNYSDHDYGRFIVSNVVFQLNCVDCALSSSTTLITVINGVASSGNPTDTTTLNIPVRIAIGNDSATFNLNNIKDSSGTNIDYHRLHGIYITKEAKSFTHELARCPLQTASGSLLDTTQLHVTNTSPKLKGFLDTTSTDFQHYLRFVILNVNSITGEFDGYVGQKSGASSVINFGQIVRSKRNIPTRYYDNNNNDYIELEYREDAISASIITSIVPVFVDIEIFPVLSNAGELLLTATCEVNWNPQANQHIVENVIDRRQFGSINELDFTQSAKDYINSVNREIDINGVIQGFDYLGPAGEISSVLFSGGVALVNGQLVNVNNDTVRLPQIQNYQHVLSTVFSTLNWAICVNKYGNFEVVLLTDTPQIFFAFSGFLPDPYYINTETFSTLVTNRKDLCIVAIAVVFELGNVISSVTDARLYIRNQSLNMPLVWTNDVLGNIGSFKTVAAMKSWVQNFGQNKSTIKVTGQIDISSPIDLSQVTNSENRISFEGDNGIFNITSGVGIIAGSFQSFKNIRFLYNPISLSYKNTKDMINVRANNIVIAGIDISIVTNNDPRGAIIAENINTLDIISCEFKTNGTNVQRPPMIHIYDGGENIRIKDNFFPNLSLYCAICFNLQTISTATSFRSVWIEDNDCQDQSITFATDFNISSSADIFSEFLVPINVNITRNRAGIIGYVALDNYFGSYDSKTSLNISDNNVGYILAPFSNAYNLYNGFAINAPTTLTWAGHFIDGRFPYINGASSNTIIKDNTAVGIFVYGKSANSNSASGGNLLVKDNTLAAADSTSIFITSFVDARMLTGGSGNLGIDPAIYIYNTNPHTTISKNSIDYYQGSPVSSYYNGIFVLGTTNAKIKDNNIGGYVLNPGNTFSGYGIFEGAGNTLYDITGNTITRNIGVDTTAFIKVGSATPGGKVSGNIFSSPFVDAANTSDAVLLGASTVKNNAVQFNCGNNSNLTRQDIFYANVADVAANDGYVIGFNYITNDFELSFSSVNFNKFLSIPLSDVLPFGSYLTSVSIQYSSSSVSTALSSLTVKQLVPVTIDTTGPTAISVLAGSGYTQTLNIVNGGNILESSPRYFILVQIESHTFSSVFIKDLIVTYRYY